MATYSEKELMEMEEEYGCFNYHPLPVVLKHGEGTKLTDVNGKVYIDGLAGYGAVNQGHRHPRIINVMKNQMDKLTLTSRAFHHDQLPVFCKYIANRFGYDRVLPMNTGVEAAESAIKIMRRYGYEQLGISKDEAVVIFPEGNFWGRSLAACSASTDPSCRINYGPFLPNMVTVPYDDVGAFRAMCELHKGKLAGFYVEPIQGEAGIIIPDKDYFKEVKAILSANGALLCVDEIQSGLGRTGKMLAMENFDVKADMVVLGKALTGGTIPGSCVMGSDKVMRVLTPGTHGSTYGGNPLACAVAVEAIKVIDDEKLCDNSTVQGERFRNALTAMKTKYQFIETIRGVGLFNAIKIVENYKISAWDICLRLMDSGVLMKPTHEHTIRFTPPLCITGAEVDDVVSKIDKVFQDCL